MKTKFKALHAYTEGDAQVVESLLPNREFYKRIRRQQDALSTALHGEFFRFRFKMRMTNCGWMYALQGFAREFKKHNVTRRASSLCRRVMTHCHFIGFFFFGLGVP